MIEEAYVKPRRIDRNHLLGKARTLKDAIPEDTTGNTPNQTITHTMPLTTQSTPMNTSHAHTHQFQGSII